MSAGSKRQTQVLYFCVRVCHKFLLSKCRGGSNLGLCTTAVLANRMPPCLGKCWQYLPPNTFFNWKFLPRIWIVFARPEHWPHDCHVQIMFVLLPTNFFVCTRTNSIKCLVNWNLLRIRVRLRNTQLHLKVGLGFVVQTKMSIEWNQLYNAFHQLGTRLGGPSETNKVVCGNSKVILMRQTCGQRSSWVAGVKHQAQAFYFFIRIGYLFLLSICRGESDLRLFETSGLAKKTQFRTANFQFKNVFGRKIRHKLALHSRILFASTEITPVRRPRSDSPSLLHFRLMLRTHTKYMCKNKRLALGVCFSQPCSSAGRKFAASRSRLNHYQTIGSFPQGQIQWMAQAL